MMLRSFGRSRRPLQTRSTTFITKPHNRRASNIFAVIAAKKNKKKFLSLLTQPEMTLAVHWRTFFFSFCVWLVLGVSALADVCSAQMAWGGRYHLSCVRKRKVILSAPCTWPHTSFHSTSQCVNETKCFSWSESWQASAISGGVWEVDIKRCLIKRFNWFEVCFLFFFFCIGETVQSIAKNK